MHAGVVIIQLTKGGLICTPLLWDTPLTMFKNPKVGKKLARCVPFLTNCDMGPRVPHRTGKYTVPGIVGQYRRVSCVDSFNQLTLQHREEQRFSAWYKATNGLMLWFATVNAFSTCHKLNLAHGGDTLFDLQWRMMEYMFLPRPKLVSLGCHAPQLVEQRRNNCVRCSKRTYCKCRHAMCISTWSALRVTAHRRRHMYARGRIWRGGPHREAPAASDMS